MSLWGAQYSELSEGSEISELSVTSGKVDPLIKAGYRRNRQLLKEQRGSRSCRQLEGAEALTGSLLIGS